MRTTIAIQDQLLDCAKRRAAQEKCTLSDIVNDALRYRLVESPPKASGVEEDQPLKTYGNGGLRAGVDLHSNAALNDRMDDR